MEEPDSVTLHYTMLTYLFDNHKLASSCFNYAWEDFIGIHGEYSHMSANELKTIFWTEIAKNIESYSLLTPKQKDYFNPDDFPIETEYEELASVLEHNEPKAGVDFTFYRSTSAYGNVNDQTVRHQNEDEMMETIKKAFANPTLYNSVFDNELTEFDEEDTRINVIAQKPPTEVDTNEDLMEIFKEIVLTDADIEAGIDLNGEELLDRIADFDWEYENLPVGLQQYLVGQYGNTVIKKYIAPQPTTSTPTVVDTKVPRFSVSSIRPQTRSQSSEVSQRRSMMDSINTNIRASPQRGNVKRAASQQRKALFHAKSESALKSSKSDSNVQTPKK